MMRDEDKTKEQLMSELHELRGRLVELDSNKAHQTSAEQALQESEERYRAFFEEGPDGVVILNQETGQPIGFNNQVCQQLGYSREEFAQLHLEDIEFSETAEEIQAHLQKVVREGRDEFETLQRTKEGEIRHVRVTARMINVGRRSYYHCMWRDITDRKQAEENLKERTKTLNDILDKAADGICVCHNIPEEPYVRFTQWNPRMTEITGYSMEEINRVGWYQSLYPDPEVRLRAVERMIRMREGDDIQTEEWEITTRSGQQKHLSISTSIVKNEAGKVHVLGIMQDITERRLARRELEASNNLLQSILNAVPDLMIVIDRDFNILYSNYKGHDLIRPGELGKFSTCYGRFKLLDAPCEDCSAEPVFDSGCRVEREMVNPADGHVREVRAFPIYDADGRVSMVVEYVRDISELKMVQEENLRRKQFLESVFYHVPDAIVTLDPMHRVIDWNPGAVKMFGYTAEQAIGKDLDHLIVCDDYYSDALSKTKQILSGERVEAFETIRHRKDGFPLHVIAAGSPIMVDQILVGAVAVYSDITDRKREEEARRLDESRLEALLQLNQMTDATMHEIAEFAMEEAVRLTQSTIGYVAFMNEHETLLTMHAWSRLAMQQCQIEDKPLDYPVDSTGLWGEAVRQRRPIITNDYQAPNPYKRGAPPGHVAMVRHMNVPIFDGARIVIVAGVGNKANDYDETDVRQLTLLMTGMWRIVQRIQAEEALRESQERFQELAELLPETIFETDINGNLMFVNQNAFAHFGFSKEDFDRGLNAFEMLAPEDRQRAKGNFRRVMNGEKIGLNEYQALRKDGSTFPAVLHSSAKFSDGKPIGLRGIVIDMTETKKLEAQLRQAHKMEAIGTLAGGIAHDFNNLLQAVHGYSELLLFKKIEGQEGYQELLEINKAAKRGSELTRQLLTFSRKMESKLEPVDLNRIVEGVRKLLERTIPKMIKIELYLMGNLHVVDADASQMGQVLMNLAVNARDAMPKGGTLSIQTRNVSVDDHFSCGQPQLTPGNYVRLAVRDTGEGIARTALEHIFDPFFTTKEVGKGTGLGLAIVYGIVKNHHGHIICTSTAGEGTLFEIYLPAAEQSGVTSNAPAPAKEVCGGYETILLVDDDDSVRDLGIRILREFGYTAISAPDGETALQFYRERKDDIDLIILDLTMPGMGGKQCLQKLLEMEPSAKVIVASGYSVNGETARAAEAGAKALINKPYDLEQMLRVVRQALD